MKKIFTLAAFGLLAASTMIAREPTVTTDFTPTNIEITGQEQLNVNVKIAGIPTDTMVSQILIELTFPEDVWWPTGAGATSVGSRVKVYDKEGNEVPPMKIDCCGFASDYKRYQISLFGYDKYNHDLNYTCVLPEGCVGDLAFSKGEMVQRVNPELRFDFNVWELLGKQRPNNTKYDFKPTISDGNAGTARINGKKTDAVVYTLTFDEDVYLNEKYHTRTSLYGIGMGDMIDPSTGKPTGEKIDLSFDDECILFEVNKDNPKMIDVTLTGINIDESNEYKLNIWQGCMGNKLWSEEEYSEGRSNPDTTLTFDPTKLAPIGVESIISDVEATDAPVYNLQGIRMNKNQLPAGIYVQSGKKVVVR